MALFTPSESPAVVVREIDLTGGVPNVQSTTGAIVGQFRWGPAKDASLVANEAELVEYYGAPYDSSNSSRFSIDFLSATQFLRYSSSLQVVREITDSTYSSFCITQNDSSTSVITQNDILSYTFDNITIDNETDFDGQYSTLSAVDDSSAKGEISEIGFIAKYPGALGNSLKVSYIGLLADSVDYDSAFNAWTYNTEFNGAPGTSVTAAAVGASNDELHLVVIDEDGQFTGTSGTVLERFPNLSILKDAKNSEGQNVFAREVINQKSQYIYMVNADKGFKALGFGNNTVADTDYKLPLASVVARSSSLTQGGDGTTLGTAEILRGFDLFEDKDQVEVDFLIAPSMASRANQTTIVNDLVSTAQSTRKDCVVVTSPARDDIIGVTSDATKVTNTVATAETFTKSSYLIADNNFLKVYDKYNDKYINIPAASTVAGVMAATDINRAAWFSPAGSRRGQLLGITSLAYSPTKGQRDTLYKAGVNPIANIPGQGSLLFGDKTFLGRPSAFDRINVRRLFLILERAIGRAAEQVLFEFNDEFTRAEFVNIVEPVLREVQGRRGITDFRVICDETNNTAAVIDRNEFKADIFIKPARSINYVTLSFVAVRTGVDFEEVVGTV